MDGRTQRTRLSPVLLVAGEYSCSFGRVVADGMAVGGLRQ